jgi:hypothetical protein
MRMFVPYDKKTALIEIEDENFVGPRTRPDQDREHPGGHTGRGNSRERQDSALHRLWRAPKLV